MQVKIKGQFLENGSYHSSKTNTDVNYTVLLVGSDAIQIRGVHQPSSVHRLDEIEVKADIRAFGNQLSAVFVP